MQLGTNVITHFLLFFAVTMASNILPGCGNMQGAASEGIVCPMGSGPKPVNVWEYEAYAKATLPKNAFDYYSSGANDMITLRENRWVAYLGLRVVRAMCVFRSAQKRQA